MKQLALIGWILAVVAGVVATLAIAANRSMTEEKQLAKAAADSVIAVADSLRGDIAAYRIREAAHLEKETRDSVTRDSLRQVVVVAVTDRNIARGRAAELLNQHKDHLDADARAVVAAMQDAQRADSIALEASQDEAEQCLLDLAEEQTECAVTRGLLARSDTVIGQIRDTLQRVRDALPGRPLIDLDGLGWNLAFGAVSFLGGYMACELRNPPDQVAAFRMGLQWSIPLRR